MNQEKSLEDYYQNPNYCLHCNSIIKILDNQRLSDVRRKKFCNHSCAASFNNKSRINNENRTCPECGSIKNTKASICKNCYDNNRRVENKTLSYYTSGHKYLTAKCQHIRKNARDVIELSGREKVCQYCKNHDFDEILEVHHIKGILEFDESTKIKEINDESNLVWLCPNHHAMLEKNLISLDLSSSNKN